LLVFGVPISGSITFGTTSTTSCEGDDSRLSDSRTPTSHASSHTNGTDDIQLATTGQDGLLSSTYVTKLNGIEAGADVTDATNVASAGAVMTNDTTTASMSFVLDEDTFSSNSATKLCSQQSIVSYVASLSGGMNLTETTLGHNDISATYRTLTNRTSGLLVFEWFSGDASDFIEGRLIIKLDNDAFSSFYFTEDVVQAATLGVVGYSGTINGGDVGMLYAYGDLIRLRFRRDSGNIQYAWVKDNPNHNDPDFHATYYYVL